jgi:peptidoglycan/LPS O-acetylase OafA/YrhL
VSIPQLTFTRFVAAFAIVALHFGRGSPPFSAPFLLPIVAAASCVVSYFFVLSGFILVVSSCRDGRLPARIPARRFWVYRVARIYPLYLFALATQLALIASHPTPQHPLAAGRIAAHGLLLQAWIPAWAITYNSPGWSLSVEAFFYLGFPALFAALVRFSGSIALLVGLLAGLVLWAANEIAVFAGTHAGVDRTLLYCFPLAHLGAFVLGAAVGVAFVRRRDWMEAQARIIGAAAVVGGAGAIYLLETSHPLAFLSHNGLFAPAYVLAILALAASRGWLARIFALRPLEYLGEISYGVYLLQLPVWVAFGGILKRTVALPPTARFYAYVVVLLAASAATHHLLEKPARAFIRRLATAPVPDRAEERPPEVRLGARP